MKKYVCLECRLKQKIKDEQVKFVNGEHHGRCARCKRIVKVRHASNV